MTITIRFIRLLHIIRLQIFSKLMFSMATHSLWSAQPHRGFLTRSFHPPSFRGRLLQVFTFNFTSILTRALVFFKPENFISLLKSMAMD